MSRSPPTTDQRTASVAQNLDSNCIQILSTLPICRPMVATMWGSGSRGSKVMSRLLSTPTGTVTITRSAFSDSPVAKRRLTPSSSWAMRETTLFVQTAIPSSASSTRVTNPPATIRSAPRGPSSSPYRDDSSDPVPKRMATSLRRCASTQSAGLSPPMPMGSSGGGDSSSAVSIVTSPGRLLAAAMAASSRSDPIVEAVSSNPCGLRTLRPSPRPSVITPCSARRSRSSGELAKSTRPAPSSTGMSQPSAVCVSMRPPVRGRASRTVTSNPASASRRAAVAPAIPAPTMAIRSPAFATASTSTAARSPDWAAPATVPGRLVEVASPAKKRRSSTGLARDARWSGLEPTPMKLKAPSA